VFPELGESTVALPCRTDFLPRTKIEPSLNVGRSRRLAWKHQSLFTIYRSQSVKFVKSEEVFGSMLMMATLGKKKHKTYTGRK